VTNEKVDEFKKYEDAKTELGSFLEWLSDISVEVENSIREVGLELLTVHQLEAHGELRKSLNSTNPIESLIFGIRHKLSRVKN